MANSTRDIRESFPLMVQETDLIAAPWLTGLLPTLLDALVFVQLPAGDLDAFDVDFRLRMVSVSPSAVEFSVDGLDISDSVVSVPVYLGRDTAAVAGYRSASASWLKADIAYAGLVTSKTELPATTCVCLHPDCLRIAQAKPSVYVLPRAYTLLADDVGPQYPYDVIDESGSECVVSVQAGSADHAEVVHALTAGSNVDVVESVAAGHVTVTGGAGLGLGMPDVTAWSDGAAAARVGAFTGLRSINGFSGDVTMEGRGAVSVLTADNRLIIRANEAQ